jgi:hypothetical protein
MDRVENPSPTPRPSDIYPALEDYPDSNSTSSEPGSEVEATVDAVLAPETGGESTSITEQKQKQEQRHPSEYVSNDDPYGLAVAPVPVTRLSGAEKPTSDTDTPHAVLSGNENSTVSDDGRDVNAARTTALTVVSIVPLLNGLPHFQLGKVKRGVIVTVVQVAMLSVWLFIDTGIPYLAVFLFEALRIAREVY